ncbi:MAG: hypothetical protein AB7F35_25525, partial [Acetobacteraceae bacterium]
MTDRQHRSSNNQQRSLRAFVTRKVEFDALLADLQRMSDDHFGADPETVLWGQAATLEHWNSR